MQKILAKKELSNFIDTLRNKKFEVVAPLKKGKVTRFSVIRKTDEMNLDALTMVPLKQVFLPEDELLYTYENGKIKPAPIETKKRVVFGMRKCDLNALIVLDKVMPDKFYKARRDKTILVGLWCENPDKFCFCNSMDLVDYYDLFFYPEGENYYISIGSKRGAEIVKDLKEADKEVVKPMWNSKKLISKDIAREYHNPLWEKDVKKCLNCTACTVYCPTCNCFDIRDVMDINPKKGKVVRKHSSCMLQGFSKVAGGKMFRENRGSRFKHFVYHKIDYYKRKHGVAMCIGCGRCLRACPPHIDWVETINQIKGGKQ